MEALKLSGGKVGGFLRLSLLKKVFYAAYRLNYYTHRVVLLSYGLHNYG